jgi:hypothetical protein
MLRLRLYFLTNIDTNAAAEIMHKAAVPQKTCDKLSDE